MYLNLIQIAESFGVSEKVVEGWIREEGMPFTPDRGRLLFDREQVAEWAAERGLAAKAGFLAPQAAGLGTSMNIGDMLRNGGIYRDVAPGDAAMVFERIVNGLPGATAAVRKLIGQRVRAAGGVTMAPVGGGFALPHPSARVTLGRDSGLVALVLLREGLPSIEAVDELPVDRLLFFIAPSPRVHLDLIARLSRLLARKPVRELMARGATDGEIFEAFDGFDAEFHS
jgi:PTS system nitrogen regulatory IIA component